MVAHLPPAVKHLLTLRSPHSLPGPPLAKLNDIFTRTFTDAQQRQVEKGWLTLTVSICPRGIKGSFILPPNDEQFFYPPTSLSTLLDPRLAHS